MTYDATTGPDPARVVTADRQSRRRRRRRTILGVLAVVLTAAAWWLRMPLFEGNFAAVDPGRVYRSAQPGSNFADTATRLGLGSVLNLRGGSIRDPFYREELATSERLGVDFYDIPISATKRPSPRELLTLVELLETCRYPLLIHCKWGSDRTGLVTALYQLTRQGASPREARGAFALAHGHVPLFGPERLHQPLDEYADWLDRLRLDHTPERFKEWLAQVYRGPEGELVGDIPIKRPRPGSRFVLRQPAGSGPAVNPAQQATAGSQHAGDSTTAASASDTSRVSATIDATSHSSGTSRR